MKATGHSWRSKPTASGLVAVAIVQPEGCAAGLISAKASRESRTPIHIKRMKLKEVAVPIAACLLVELSGQGADLTISHSPGQVTLGYLAETGRCYEVWATTDLDSDTWTGPIETRIGTGNEEAVPISTAGFDRRFFQLRISDLAPGAVDFQNQVVGGMLADTNYRMTSATRFSWFGQTGDWTYTKNDADSATIIFTYDAYANSPAIYREEISLTFTGKGTGTYDYCEYNFNVCDSESEIMGDDFTL